MSFLKSFIKNTLIMAAIVIGFLLVLLTTFGSADLVTYLTGSKGLGAITGLAAWCIDVGLIVAAYEKWF